MPVAVTQKLAGDPAQTVALAGWPAIAGSAWMVTTTCAVAALQGAC